MRPICVACGVEMSCAKNGRVVEMANPETGNPLFRWSGDEFRCRACGVRVVVGVGSRVDAHNSAFVSFGWDADEQGGPVRLKE